MTMRSRSRRRDVLGLAAWSAATSVPGLGGLVASASSGAARAQAAPPAGVPGYPGRPIRMILPLGPGSSGDTNSRFIAERLATRLGQQVLPENRPGGEMQIALQALLQAPADGHALMFISPSSMVVNPLIVDNWSIDVRRRVRPIVLSTRSQTVFVVREGSPHRTMAGLLAEARARPQSVSLATFSRYYEAAATRLARLAGAEFNPVAYKGAGQGLTDVAGGSVDLMLTDISSVMPLIEAGKLRALAVTSPERLAQLPAVPTVKELGYRDYEFSIWVGYGLRSETPEPVVQLLTTSLIAILRSPEFETFNRSTGNTEIVALDGVALQRQIDRETEQLKATLAPAR